MAFEARDGSTTVAPSWLHATRRGAAAVGGGLLGLAGSLASAADKGGKAGGSGGKDNDKSRDGKEQDGGRRDGGRDRDRDNEDRDDPTRRDAAQRDGAKADQTKAEHRTERGERREQADQTDEDDTTDATADDDSTRGDASGGLRARANDLRDRLGDDRTADVGDGGHGPVDILVDLEQEAEDAVDVDLNIPDLSDLLAGLPEGVVGVEDDIVFAQAGDSLAITGDLGTFAISNPDDGDDDGGDNDVDFSS